MYRKDTLSNGIRVVSETLPKSRSVSIGVWVKVGCRRLNEQQQREGRGTVTRRPRVSKRERAKAIAKPNKSMHRPRRNDARR